MEQVVLCGAGSLNAAAAAYCFPYGYSVTVDTDITTRYVIAPAAGTLSNLRARVSAAPGATRSWAFTMYKNGSSTALTCTISGTATLEEDITNSVSVNAGDLLALEVAPTNTPAGATATFGYSYTPSAGATACLLNGTNSAPSTTATRYVHFGGVNGIWRTTLSDAQVPWNINATITSLYVAVATAPGAGKSRAFTIMKNGSAEGSSTVTISDANTAASVTGLSIDVAPGDLFELRSTPSGTPAATASVYWGSSYTPDIDGQYCVSGQDGDTSIGNSEFQGLAFTNSGFAANARNSKAGGATLAPAVTAKSIYVYLSTDPGVGNSRSVALHVDGSDSALLATVSSGSTTAITTTDVTTTRDQLVTLRHTQSGAPASTTKLGVSVLFQVVVTGGNQYLPLLGVGT